MVNYTQILNNSTLRFTEESYTTVGSCDIPLTDFVRSCVRFEYSIIMLCVLIFLFNLIMGLINTEWVHENLDVYILINIGFTGILLIFIILSGL